MLNYLRVEKLELHYSSENIPTLFSASQLESGKEVALHAALGKYPTGGESESAAVCLHSGANEDRGSEGEIELDAPRAQCSLPRRVRTLPAATDG